jgi:hypothetical protein
MALLLPGQLRNNGTQEKANSIISRWSNSHLGLVLHRVLGNVTKRWVSSASPEERLANTADTLDATHTFKAID